MPGPRTLDDLWDDEPAASPAAEVTVTVTTEVRQTLVAKVPIYDRFADEDPFAEDAPGSDGSVEPVRDGSVTPAYDPFVNEDPFAEDDDVSTSLYQTAPPEEHTDEEPAAGGPPALTVSQLTQHVSALLRSDVLLTDFWVRGEISNLSRPTSGHVYFSLKDESACVACVMWGRDAALLPFRPETGMQVLAHGRLEVYAQRGVYQIICRELQPDGLGSLYLSLEQSKARLAAEGLLDPGRKRPLPRYPRRVAVVTSLGGAAVRDVCVILRRDAHPVDVVLIPAQMQGVGAEAAIIAGLDRANRLTDVDLVIVARGGGAVEDLWTFNSEMLCRAIAVSRLPVISAVGHETDFTLADFVADVRAPTPTAAAEMVAALRADVHRRAERAQQRIVALVSNAVRTGRLRLEHLCSRPLLRRPERLLDPHRQRLDEATSRLMRAREAILSARRNSLGLAAGRLEALSPLATLSRGYGLVTRTEDGRRVVTLADVEVDDSVRVRLTDGDFQARVTALNSKGEQDE
jgi:exodeoxyribonuclease VII large subunit